MSRSLIGLALAILSLFAALGNTARAQDAVSDPTKWTSNKGKTIEAEFVRLEDDGVVLKLKSNGQQATVPFASLNLDSHLKALKLARPEEFSKPLVKAEIAPVIEPPPLIPIDVDATLRSPFNENQSLEQFASTIAAELDRGNLFVLWHALPDKMQEDLQVLISKGMEKIGLEKVVQIRAITKNLHKIFAEQKDFVFANPALMEEKEARKGLYANWLILEQVTGSFADESLWQKENFEEANVERWLAHFTSVLGANLVMGKELAPAAGAPVPSASNLIRVVASQEDKGKISIALPIPFFAPQELVARKVRGQWVIPAWMNDLRTGLDEGLAKIDEFDASKIQGPTQLFLASVSTPVSGLANAKTQEDFDQVIQDLMPLIEQAKAGFEMQMESAMAAGMGPGMPGMPGPGGNQGFQGRDGGGMGGGMRGGGLGSGAGGSGGGMRGGGLGSGAGPGGRGSDGGGRRGGGLGGVGL